MIKNILLLSLPFVVANGIANEMTTQSWNFPTPEQTIISQNRVLLFCDANPSKCPDKLFFSRRGGGGGGGASGGGLVNPSTNSTANNVTVVLSGDNSSIVLNSDQASEGNTLETSSETNPTIDYEETLNFTTVKPEPDDYKQLQNLIMQAQ